MGKKEPAWRAYEKAVQHHIPRLKDGEELEHRAKLLWIRDHCQKERERSGWQEDQILTTMISLTQVYALSTRLAPHQIKGFWDAISDLALVVAKVRALGLE